MCPRIFSLCENFKWINPWCCLLHMSQDVWTSLFRFAVFSSIALAMQYMHPSAHTHTHSHMHPLAHNYMFKSVSAMLFTDIASILYCVWSAPKPMFLFVLDCNLCSLLCNVPVILGWLKSRLLNVLASVLSFTPLCLYLWCLAGEVKYPTKGINM